MQNKEASSAQVNGRSQGKQLITKGSPTFKRKKLNVKFKVQVQVVRKWSVKLKETSGVHPFVNRLECLRDGAIWTHAEPSCVNFVDQDVLFGLLCLVLLFWNWLSMDTLYMCIRYYDVFCICIYKNVEV
ncbi:hypothetical protein ACSBR2_042327 [Camellia fascicularis]